MGIAIRYQGDSLLFFPSVYQSLQFAKIFYDISKYGILVALELMNEIKLSDCCFNNLIRDNLAEAFSNEVIVRNVSSVSFP